jgi:DNA gyrase subunit A
LASDKKLWGVIRTELENLLEQPFIVRRKTRMAGEEDVLQFDENAYIIRENTNVILTRDGWIKRVGRLTSLESTRVREGDEIIAVVPATTLDPVVFFADDGTAYTMRANEVPSSSGYGEPITKFFKLADQVKVITALSTDPRFLPPESPDGPQLLIALSSGYVLRLPFATYRAESTKAGRRYAKPEAGDKVVLVRLIRDEDGLMLASREGHVIHFALEEVNLLSGVGKGVIGLKLEKDVCLGGTLVTDGRRNEQNRLLLELESGKTDEYTPERIRRVARGGKGDRVRARSSFTRVIPPPIELVNWDEVDGKTDRK